MEWKELSRNASRSLNLISDKKINEVLLILADGIEEKCADILKANAFDLAKMEPGNPLYDRLQLTPERVQAIASDIRNVAQLPSRSEEHTSELQSFRRNRCNL